MKNKKLLWLLPAVLLGAGIYLTTVPIADFLAAACFVLAALTVVVLLLPTLHKRKPKLAVLIAMLLAVSVFLGICLMTVTIAKISNARKGAPETEMAYIVVLGAKVKGTEPSDTLQCRIDAAYDYLMAYPDTIAIVSGGKGDDETMSEAKCMENALLAKGIAQNRLWLEERATSTWENITFSLDLIEEKTGNRPERIGVVTSEFHLYRASLFASDCGVDMVGIPGETEKTREYIYYFLREVAGVWHYHLLGGQYHD